MAIMRLVQKQNPNGKQGPGGLENEEGERQEGFVAYHEGKRRNGFEKEGWVAMSKTAVDILAEDKNLKGADFRVLFKLVAHLDFENWILVTQAKIGEDLRIRAEHVSKSIRRLVEGGYILKGPKSGLQHAYRLNPEIGWMGSAKRHKIALGEQGGGALRETKIEKLRIVIGNKWKAESKVEKNHES